MMNQETLEKIAKLEMQAGAGAGKNITISNFLQKLLTTLWAQGEEFNPKRPFGNSGWQLDIATTLVYFGVVHGTLDEDFYLEDYDQDAVDYVVQKVIDYVFQGEQQCTIL